MSRPGHRDWGELYGSEMGQEYCTIDEVVCTPRQRCACCLASPDDDDDLIWVLGMAATTATCVNIVSANSVRHGGVITLKSTETVAWHGREKYSTVIRVGFCPVSHVRVVVVRTCVKTPIEHTGTGISQ